MSDNTVKRIIIETGKPPQFDGAWNVGEVLQVAQQLAAWVERLQVNSPTEPDTITEVL